MPKAEVSVPFMLIVLLGQARLPLNSSTHRRCAPHSWVRLACACRKICENRWMIRASAETLPEAMRRCCARVRPSRACLLVVVDIGSLGR